MVQNIEKSLLNYHSSFISEVGKLKIDLKINCTLELLNWHLLVRTIKKKLFHQMLNKLCKLAWSF